jgi:hypothetical protein
MQQVHPTKEKTEIISRLTRELHESYCQIVKGFGIQNAAISKSIAYCCTQELLTVMFFYDISTVCAIETSIVLMAKYASLFLQNKGSKLLLNKIKREIDLWRMDYAKRK